MNLQATQAQKRTLLWKTIATVLLLLVVVLAGSVAVPLHGLPLSNYLLGGVMVMVIVVWNTTWSQSSSWRRLVIGALFMLIGVQLIGFVAFRAYGWSACVTYWPHIIDETAQPRACEPSAQIRVRGNATFILANVHFDQTNMPVYFMNGGSYNFYLPDQPERNHLSYHLRFSTYAKTSKDASITVATTVPNTAIFIDNAKYTVPTDHDTRFALPNGSTPHIIVAYGTDRRLDTDQITIKLTHAQPYFDSQATRNSAILRLFQTLWLLIASAFALVFLVLLAIDFIALPKTSRLLIAVWIAILAILSSRISFPIYPVFASVIVALITSFFLLERGRVSFGWWRQLLFILFAFVFASKVLPYPYAFLYSGGNDELGHEIFARAVLTASSWRDGLESAEPGLFYYQPLHRYFLALLHKITGDSLWGPYFIQTLIATGTMYFGARILYRLAGGLAFVLFLLGYWFIAIHPDVSIFSLAQSGYQQSLATPLFITTLLLFIYAQITAEKRPLAHLGLGALLGSVIMMRTDYAPALLGVIIYCALLWRQQQNLKTTLYGVVALTLGLIIAPCAVLYRNHIIGGTYFLFPTSGMVNLLPVFRPLFGYTGGPSQISGLTMITTIVRHYAHNLGELWHILATNMMTGLIGDTTLHRLVYATFALSIPVGFVLPKSRRQWTVLVMYLAFLLPILATSTFFIYHNGWVMFVMFDFLVIVYTLLVVGMIGQTRPSATKHKI